MDNVVYLPTRSLQITLSVNDPAVLRELESREHGASREAFATEALRLGVLALRQANTTPNAEIIHLDTVRLLAHVGAELQQRTAALSNALVEYLDPASGLLPQRIEQLSQPGGDLETMLGLPIKGKQSACALAMANRIGAQSPIGKRFSAKQRDGLLGSLAATLEKALDEQREEVLKQFSLNRQESALARFLVEIANWHGELRSERAADARMMAREFSIADEDGVLFRLVSRIEQAQATITREFSLEHEGSALRRLAWLLDGASAGHSSVC